MNIYSEGIMQTSHQITAETLQQQMYEKKKVIVRIWTSAINLINPGHSVGHVSIEIPKEKIYWSLWPKQEQNGQPSAQETEGLGIFTPISTEQLDNFTYQKDRDFEGRDPELEFNFYTLNILNITLKFQELCREEIKWNIIGRLFFSNAGSCASSAWELLKAGGINDLVSPLKQSMISSTGSWYGSLRSSIWGTKASRHHLTDNQMSERDNASNQSTLAASYALEMTISPLVSSPDFIGELLKKAKEQELKNIEANKTISHKPTF